VTGSYDDDDDVDLDDDGWRRMSSRVTYWIIRKSCADGLQGKIGNGSDELMYRVKTYTHTDWPCRCC
jgi:hypothetical protein